MSKPGRARCRCPFACLTVPAAPDPKVPCVRVSREPHSEWDSMRALGRLDLSTSTMEIIDL
jgi:hypothetical protein